MTEPIADAELFGPEAERAKAAAARREVLNSQAPLIDGFFQSSMALMMARAKKEALPIPLPWPDVAKALGGGLWPGLHVLTGATGKGKTQFALQLAWEAAGKGVPVLYVGLELGEADITARLLALADGETNPRAPKWSDVFLGKLQPGVLEELRAKHAQAFRERPFRAEFGPPHGWPYSELAVRVEALREENPEPTPGASPLLVVVDYLQAIGTSPDERLDLREQISKAAYAARAVARDYGAAVLMLSSVARENTKRLRVKSGDEKAEGVTPPHEGTHDADVTPPSDLVGLGKESGEIEYAADTVMALVSGNYDLRSKITPMHLAVAKVRAGRSSWCSLEFDGSKFSAGPVTTDYGDQR